jgi:hypothetical protein
MTTRLTWSTTTRAGRTLVATYLTTSEFGGRRSSELVEGAVLKVCAGSGHALPDTERDRLHADLLEFIDS